MSVYRETYQATEFAVIMWRRRVEAASSVSTGTRQSLVRAELKLASILEALHIEALQIDAEITHTIARAAVEAPLAVLTDLLANPTSVSALSLPILRAVLTARLAEDPEFYFDDTELTVEMLTTTELVLCDCCALWAANRDHSGCDTEGCTPLSQLTEGDVFISDTEPNEFSTAACDGCGDHLAGRRHDATLITTD